MASGAGTVDSPLPTLRREGISKLPYADDYEMKAAVAQESTVGQELQGIHKQISEFDELLDQLGARLEAYLVPDHPRPAPDEVASPRDNKSAFRTEIHVIQNRMRTQLNRLSNLVVRIDQ